MGSPSPRPLPQAGGEGKGEGASACLYNYATLNKIYPVPAFALRFIRGITSTTTFRIE
jgi:hypothetical protein